MLANRFEIRLDGMFLKPGLLIANLRRGDNADPSWEPEPASHQNIEKIAANMAEEIRRFIHRYLPMDREAPSGDNIV